MDGKNTESPISLNLLKYSLNHFRNPSIIQGIFPNYRIFRFRELLLVMTVSGLRIAAIIWRGPPNIIDRCLQKLSDPRMPERRLHEHRVSYSLNS